MTTVTGSVGSLKTTARPGAQLRWKYRSYPAYVEGRLISSAEDVVTSVDGTGDFHEALTAGDYDLSIDGNPNDKWVVRIPTGSSSYDIIALIISPTTVLPTPPTPAVVPNGSSSVLGVFKSTKDGANIRVATGIWFVADVAALKALPSDASNSGAFLTSPLAGEPSKVYWDQSSSAADDPTGFTVIKPTDNPATGRWIPF